MSLDKTANIKIDQYLGLLIPNLSLPTDKAIPFLYSLMQITIREGLIEERIEIVRKILKAVCSGLYGDNFALGNTTDQSKLVISNLIKYFTAYPDPSFIYILNEESQIFENIFNTSPSELFILYERYINLDIDNPLLLKHLNEVARYYYADSIVPNGKKFIKPRLLRLISTLTPKVSE